MADLNLIDDEVLRACPRQSAGRRRASSISSFDIRCDRAMTMAWTALRRARSTQASKALSNLTQSSGALLCDTSFNLRAAVPDIVASVFWIDQHLVHSSAGPRTSCLARNLAGVQFLGDVGFRSLAFHEAAIDPSHHLDLFVRPQREDHAVGLDAFCARRGRGCPSPNRCRRSSADEDRSRPPTLPKAKLDQAALAGKHLGGQVTAVFPRHDALDALDNFRAALPSFSNCSAQYSSVMPARRQAQFVGRAFIGILEATPAADVVDQDHGGNRHCPCGHRRAGVAVNRDRRCSGRSCHGRHRSGRCRSACIRIGADCVGSSR